MSAGGVTKWTGAMLAALVVWSCGGKVVTSNESGGGSGGAFKGGSGGSPGGSGGVPSGGSGGTLLYGGGGGPPGGAGGMPSGGTGGGVPCAEGECPSYKVAGLIDMLGCCLPSGACGAVVDQTISTLIKIPEGCYESGVPGTPDSSCPPYQFINPINNQPTTFPGCCRSSTGTCGVTVDMTSQSGPNFGCADINGPGDDQPCGGSEDCSTCVQNQCAAEISACFSDAACSQYVNCASSCFDQPCVDKCALVYPPGPAWTPFENCILAKCAAVCT